MMTNAVRISYADQVHLESLPYRYPMRTVTTLEAELRQIELCMARKYPRLYPRPLREDTLCVVGYGPSLQETWREITQPCITMSGSHDFLLAKGIIPTWHAQCDGRDHQAKFIEHPHPDTTYLMSTICPPKVWDQLEGHTVLTWHNAHGQHVVDWIAAHDPGGLLVAGGSNIGMASIHLGGLLGFRKFKLFGFDGCFKDKARHAGVHHDPQPQRMVTRCANGHMWNTSPQMSNACDELVWLMRDAPHLDIEVVGDSLQRDVVEDYIRTRGSIEQ